ncbi:MAG: hypothetical protein MK033_07570 [Candidatus Caenarcaniphilales bacterium]|nr:hypothetical protein [Candidatus Caenarcaniphilales bacterium]
MSISNGGFNNNDIERARQSFERSVNPRFEITDINGTSNSDNGINNVGDVLSVEDSGITLGANSTVSILNKFIQDARTREAYIKRQDQTLQDMFPHDTESFHKLGDFQTSSNCVPELKLDHSYAMENGFLTTLRNIFWLNHFIQNNRQEIPQSHLLKNSIEPEYKISFNQEGRNKILRANLEEDSLNNFGAEIVNVENKQVNNERLIDYLPESQIIPILTGHPNKVELEQTNAYKHLDDNGSNIYKKSYENIGTYTAAHFQKPSLLPDGNYVSLMEFDRGLRNGRYDNQEIIQALQIPNKKQLSLAQAVGLTPSLKIGDKSNFLYQPLQIKPLEQLFTYMDVKEQPKMGDPNQKGRAIATKSTRLSRPLQRLATFVGSEYEATNNNTLVTPDGRSIRTVENKVQKTN